ncbi:MAG: hypothetical protein EXR99_01555 [Gemmataceae bacterium]|nr:hypothetical protein [Gemmataceae bacterium]
MKYAARIEYIQDVEKINSVRPAHRAYLENLLSTGKLAASGPFTDGYGALIVYETETREGAEGLIKGDPFFQNGIFVKWDLHPWKCVFFSPERFS